MMFRLLFSGFLVNISNSLIIQSIPFGRFRRR